MYDKLFYEEICDLEIYVMFYLFSRFSFSFSSFFFFFLPFRAAPTAYGGSQARGEMGAVAARAIVMQDPSHVCEPTPQLMATRDPQPIERGQGSNLCPHGC